MRVGTATSLPSAKNLRQFPLIAKGLSERSRRLSWDGLLYWRWFRGKRIQFNQDPKLSGGLAKKWVDALETLGNETLHPGVIGALKDIGGAVCLFGRMLPLPWLCRFGRSWMAMDVRDGDPGRMRV